MASIGQLNPLQIRILQYLMGLQQNPAEQPVIERKPRKHKTSKPAEKKQISRPKTDIPTTMPPDTRGTATEKHPKMTSVPGGDFRPAEAKTLDSGLMGMKLDELRKSNITRKPKRHRIFRRRPGTQAGVYTESGSRITTEDGRAIQRG